MPRIRTPEVLDAPFMRDEDEPLDQAWTRQPGLDDDDYLAVDVLGPSDEVLKGVPAVTAEVTKFDKAAADGPSGSIVRLRPYQGDAVRAIDAAWESGKKAPIIVMATGCHRAGQLLRMADGSTKQVEHVQEGDVLRGPYSDRTVLKLHRGEGWMVRVIPEHGDAWVVNEGHILTLRSHGEIVDISVFAALEARLTDLAGARLWRRFVVSDDDIYVSFRLQPTYTFEYYFGFTLDGDGRYLLEDGTVTHNSGKTVVAGDVMRRHAETGERAVFLAHRKELLTQTIGKVRLMAPKVTIGLVKGETRDCSSTITVASVQSLQNVSGARIAEIVSHGVPSLLIVDECHHARAPSYMRVIEGFRAANPELRICGLTATPGRADGLALDDVFDCVAYEKNTIDLINEGYLVPPVGVSVTLNIRLDDVDTEDGDYKPTSLSRVMDQPAVREVVVAKWREHGHNRKTLVFCCDVAHAQNLAQLFSDSGVSAAWISGAMKEKDRDALLGRFRRNEVKVLCSVQVLTEGFDDPSIECILFSRPTQSHSLYAQMLGRGLRPFMSKTECLVIDTVGNSDRHPPVQLASLAGLNPVDPTTGTGKQQDEPALGEATVDGTRDRVIDFHFRRRESRYAWRETSAGWTLAIPKLGHFLVAWHDKDHTRATVRYHDMRSGKRDTPPLSVVHEPIDFNMAYGLVEAEVERIFGARSSRARANERDEVVDDAANLFSFIALDEGFDEELVAQVTYEGAGWRLRTTTEKQHAALIRLGVKASSVPENSGEAADLLTVLQVERDTKRREPATPKQVWYVRSNGLTLPEGATLKTLTKAQAAKLIYTHRAKVEPRKSAAEKAQMGLLLGGEKT